MQHPAYHRLPEPVWLFERSLSAAGDCRDRQLRPHQTALLLHPRRHQPDTDRADWTKAGPELSSWKRAVGVKAGNGQGVARDGPRMVATCYPENRIRRR